MPENASLTAKQERFITALLAVNNIAVAARTSGINESTAHRWLKLAHVQAALKAAQKQLFDQELTELARIVGKAILTLDRNMSGEEVMPSTQVRAAQIVLEQAIAVHKMSELEAEIAELRGLVMVQDAES